MGCHNRATYVTKGRNAGSTKAAIAEYERIPLTVMYGIGTKEEKKAARETVKRFINEAEIGNEYVASGGTGGKSETFTIVEYNRSPNKMGIKSGNRRPVAFNTTNAKKYLATNVKLVKGTKKEPSTNKK